MPSNLNKERILFLVGTALFAWVMLKLGLTWRREIEKPSTPKAPAASAKRGDPDIRGQLAMKPLSYYADRGTRNPFFPDVGQPAAFYVRTTVHHALLASAGSSQGLVRSRFAFDCRMGPIPVREVRFHIPEEVIVTQVHSNEIDPDRPHGRQGEVYVVPVRPAEEKRAYYRCQITLATQTPITVPSKWTAPAVVCTGAMPRVTSESGYIGLTSPGDRVEFAPLSEDPTRTGLERLPVESQWPKAFAETSTKSVYRYKKPAYQLALDLKRKKGTEIAVTPKVEPKIDPKVGPKVEPKVGPKIEPKIEPKVEPTKVAIPKPESEQLPLKVPVIYRLEGPEPRFEAVLRHNKTGEYFRKCEGDTVLDGLRIAKITDNSVTIEDPKRGKTFILPGRFANEYEK